MAEMGTKLNVFKDPYLDRASETADLMAKIKSLNDPSGGAGLGSGAHGMGLDGGKDMLDDMHRLSDDLKAKSDRLNEM